MGGLVLGLDEDWVLLHSLSCGHDGIGEKKSERMERLIWMVDTCLFHPYVSSNAHSTLRRTTMDDYQHVKVRSSSSICMVAHLPQALHHSLPAFSPIVPTSLLPFVAALFLLPTFALAFYFSTYVVHSSPVHNLTDHPSLPKDKLSIREPLVALLASTLGGFGIVALFCSVGVYV